MSLSHSPLIVRDGLVLCLDAANPRSYPKSGTTWSDLAGANDGTLTNGPTFDADDKGSIVFDGSNEYVNMGDLSYIFNNVTQYSVNLWFYHSGSNSLAGIFGKLGTSGSLIAIQIYSTSLYFHPSDSNSKRGYIDSFSQIIPTDQWTHVGMVYNGSGEEGSFTTAGNVKRLKVFINGQQVSINYDGNIPTSTGSIGSATWALGAWRENRELNGGFSGLSIYNRALTASEVLQNYNATRGRYGI